MDRREFIKTLTALLAPAAMGATPVAPGNPRRLLEIFRETAMIEDESVLLASQVSEGGGYVAAELRRQLNDSLAHYRALAEEALAMPQEDIARALGMFRPGKGMEEPHLSRFIRIYMEDGTLEAAKVRELVGRFLVNETYGFECMVRDAVAAEQQPKPKPIRAVHDEPREPHRSWDSELAHMYMRSALGSGEVELRDHVLRRRQSSMERN